MKNADVGGTVLRWVDDQVFTVGETEFLSSGDKDFNDLGFLAQFIVEESTNDRFVVWKTRAIIDRYTRIVGDPDVRNIFELGILKGGSTVFLAAVSAPRKLVAIELEVARIAALDEFVTDQGLADRVRMFYGVDQGDVATVGRILDAEFDEPLDFVVDDASHMLDLTRALFNLVFPRLRPGGVYVIEDWSWAQRAARHRHDVARAAPHPLDP